MQIGPVYVFHVSDPATAVALARELSGRNKLAADIRKLAVKAQQAVALDAKLLASLQSIVQSGAPAAPNPKGEKA